MTILKRLEKMRVSLKSNQNLREMFVKIDDFFPFDTSKIEDKIIALNSNIFIKPRASEKSYWSSLQEEKYPCS